MWSDGTYSLLIGSQLFEAQSSLGASTQYLAVRLKSARNVMRIEKGIKETMILRLYPAQKDSEQFKGLMASKHTRRAKTKDFFLLQDPERYAGDLGKIEMEKMEARKQLRNMRLATERKYNRSSHKTYVSQDAHISESDESQYNDQSDNYDDDDYSGNRTDTAKRQSREETPRERIARAKYASTELPPSPQVNPENDSLGDNADDDDSDASDGLITHGSRKRRVVIHHDDLEYTL